MHRLVVLTSLSFLLISAALLAEPPGFKTRDELMKEFQDTFKEAPETYFLKLRKRTEVRAGNQSSGIFELAAPNQMELDTCRRDLGRLKTEYRTLRTQGLLAPTLKDKEPHYRRMAVLRDRLIDALGKCGECTSRVRRISPSEYESKASCFNPSQAPNKREAFENAYQIARRFVSRVRNFEKREGGFNYLITFQELTNANVPHPQSGEELLIPNFPRPLKAGLVVEGLAGLIGLGYVIDNYWLERGGNVRESVIQFNRQDSPYRPTGKSFPEGRNMLVNALDDVRGYWYIDNQGYVEYNTVGKFPALVIGSLTPAMALRIAMDTTWHLLDGIMFQGSVELPGENNPR